MSASVLVRESRHVKQEFDISIVQGTYLDHIERYGKTNHAVVSRELFLVVVSFSATK